MISVQFPIYYSDIRAFQANADDGELGAVPPWRIWIPADLSVVWFQTTQESVEIKVHVLSLKML